MNLIKLLCPLLIVVLLLSSCNVWQSDGGQSSLEGTPIESPSDTTPPEPTEPLTNEEMLELLRLMPDKQDLPSYDDLCKVKEGMRLEEVYSILGNPQAMPALSTGGIGYSYESDDGWSIIINYSVYNTVYSDIQGFCVMKVNIFEIVPPEA
jgi:hypothetical protein